MQHDVHHEILPNGISLIVVPMPGTAAVTSIVFMNVGSRYESDAQKGLAHFTEHMVFKGGKKYLNAQAISQALDSVGGEFNAFTSLELTGFYTKTAAEHLELGIDVLSDMVLHASFPEDELEKEKGVIVEELNMYEDIPMRKVDHVLMELVFGDLPLGRAIIGTKESIRSFTREDFIKYREQFYHGGSCTIALAGAVTVEKARSLVQEAFAELPSGAHEEPSKAFFQPNSRLSLHEKKSEQSHLMLAVEAFPNADPRRYALRVLSTILGGNMSSRLFVSVREEQGLCYYVRSGLDTYQDIGMLVASAGVDNTRLHQAVTAIITEFRKLRDESVTQVELDRAKQFLIGKTHLAMEDSEEVAEYYGSQDLIEKTQDTVEQTIEEIKKVTIEDVHNVAKDIFTEQGLHLAVVGPHEDTSALEALVTFTA